MMIVFMEIQPYNDERIMEIQPYNDECVYGDPTI